MIKDFKDFQFAVIPFFCVLFEVYVLFFLFFFAARCRETGLIPATVR